MGYSITEGLRDAADETPCGVGMWYDGDLMGGWVRIPAVIAEEAGWTQDDWEYEQNEQGMEEIHREWLDGEDTGELCYVRFLLDGQFYWLTWGLAGDDVPADVRAQARVVLDAIAASNQFESNVWIARCEEYYR